MRRSTAPFLGGALHFGILSLPLLLADVQFTAYLTSPVTWAFYILTGAFFMFESNASACVEDAISVCAKRMFLPYIVGVVMLLVFWISIHHHANTLRPGSTTTLVAGTLVAAGIWTRVVSIKTLNKFFLSHIGVADNHKLITTGIYSLVRHPSEAGLLLICFGVPILLSSSVGLSLTILLLLPLSLYRAAMEDRVMLVEFSNEFSKYRSSVPALLPRLRRNLFDKANWAIR